MSNPAFQLFIAMAQNFENPRTPLPATTPPTPSASKHVLTSENRKPSKKD